MWLDFVDLLGIWARRTGCQICRRVPRVLVACDVAFQIDTLLYATSNRLKRVYVLDYHVYSFGACECSVSDKAVIAFDMSGGRRATDDVTFL